METRVLRYFLTVAQEENITKAAELLHTSQSNLSRQLADLEDSLGKKLFERGSRKITLTEEGMFLRKRAQEIIELTDRTENDMKSFNQSISGTVHIGGVETCLMKLIGKSMLSLSKLHPQIRYDFFSGSIVELTEMLNKGLLDFALLVAPVDMQKYNYLKLPTTDTFGVLMRKDCPLADQTSIKPEDVKDYPVWVAHQQLGANVLSSWLGRDMESLNIISTFNLITTPAMMIDSGMGMAFTFNHLVNTEGTNLCFRPLEPKIEAELYLVWKKYDMFAKAGEVFLQQIQKDFSGMEQDASNISEQQE
ncbi:LysR family transcriptional regulator [Eisenbergiella sp.]